MKVIYSIAFEDYQALYPPFTLRPGRNLEFKGVIVACAAIALLGVFCMVQGLGALVGCFLIAVAACFAIGTYFLDKRSVRQQKDKYNRNILAAFQRLHCRDQRTIETDQDGMHFGCKCGTVVRPWSSLKQFSENKLLFLVATGTENQIIPKRCFASDGEMTEFRKLFLENLQHDQPLNYWAVDFAQTKRDLRYAYLLHTLSGGGWRRLLTAALSFVIGLYGVFVIGSHLTPESPALICGLIGAFLAMPVLKFARRRRKHYFGPLRICFGDQGLQVQFSGTLARLSWNQFIGYLENNRVLLLYTSPRTYRVIPKRSLVDRESQLRALITAKLVRYNYRNPIPIAGPERPIPSQSAS